MSKNDSVYSMTKAILGQLDGDTSLRYDSTYTIVEAIYHELGGNETDFDSTYAIVAAILEGLENGTIAPGTPVSGTLAITANGDYDVATYASASVSVPAGIIPSGTLAIADNGEYEVSTYASASVNVPQGTFTSGNLNIIENGNYNVNSYESASVNVPQGVFPSGTLPITVNGTYDVTSYASASVEVEGGGTIVTDFSELPLSFKCVQSGSFQGKSDAKSRSKDIYYSLDGGNTWTAFDENVTLNLEEGDIVSLGANWGQSGWNSSNSNPLFQGTALVDVFGNIDSLIDKENFKTFQSSSYYQGTFTFKNLFSGNTHIRDCYDLVLPCPDTSLHSQQSTYGGMFNGSSITVAPREISATTLGYESCLEMFANCANLVRASKLKATSFLNNYCCAHMYNHCTNLVDVPNFEPIERVSDGAFEDMFGYCASLVIPPELPLYAIAGRVCDSMFQNCTSLREAPGLPFTGSMQAGWQGGVYKGMFKNCSNLEFVPELPAEDLDNQCYKDMFFNCPALKRAPVILATRIRNANSLQGMFEACTNLTFVDIPYVTSSSATTGYQDWLKAVSGSGIINVNASYANQAQYPLSSSNGVPEGWTVVAEQPFTLPA